MSRNDCSSITRKKESSLHRSLKFRYSESGATETPVGGYVCDGLSGEGEYIEVQTGSFGPLREKVEFLTQSGKVRVIHPIINQKHIELYNSDGSLLRRRKSPMKGNPWDVFKALLYAPELPLLKNLVIELVIVDVIEKRIDDGQGSWRRRGVSISDRQVGAWLQTIVLAKPKDYTQFLPFRKNERFSVRDLAEKAGIDVGLARKAIYVLAKMCLIERTGKRGRALIYQRK
jgi:hypothetical protein